jgi:hypothetical protein
LTRQFSISLGPDAVAGGLEDIVAAALVPEVACLVHDRGVAGAAPAVVGIAGELGAVASSRFQ